MSEPPQKNVKIGQVSAQRPRPVRVFLSYATDADDWPEKVALLLDVAAQDLSLPVEFAIHDGRPVEFGPQPFEASPIGQDLFVAFITPRYLDTPPSPVHLDEAAGARHQIGLRLKEVEQRRAPDGLNLRLMPAEGPPLLSRTDPSGVLRTLLRETLQDLVRAGVVPGPGPANEVARAPDRAESSSAAEYLIDRWNVGPGAAEVLRVAERIALPANAAPRLDTSTILIALGELGGTSPPEWTGDWVRERLAQGLARLESQRSASAPAGLPHLHPPVSTGVVEALDAAAEIARRTSPVPRIHSRHLFAAIITNPRGRRARTLGLLEDAGVDLAESRRAYFEFVRGGPGDDEDAWGRVLLGESTEPPRLSEFSADCGHGEDYLRVGADVLAFARLVAARTLKPPLAIGLFGEWGSGKTFFMRLLRREVDRLSAGAEASGWMQRDLPFYKRIVQIEFNAWHYVEENLWASLANHIFESLGRTERPSESRQLHERLSAAVEEERTREADARREQKETEAELARARESHAEALEAFRRRWAETPTGQRFLRGVDVTELRFAAEPLLAALGVPRVGPSAAELQSELAKARAELQRLHGIAAPLLHGDLRDRVRRWALLGAALLAPVALGAGATLLSDHVGAIGGLVTAAGAALPALTLWVRRQTAAMRRWADELEKVQHRLNEHVVDAYDRVRGAAAHVAEREMEGAAALRTVEEARESVAAAEARLRAASLTEVLAGLVAERVGSNEYGRQLGTLARIRDDFERLSSLIEEENWRLDPPVDGEDLSTRGLPKFESLEEERRHGSRRVNRIVLYIDDLDRCPPARVVEVLQAVHLLLAFPLFVVVVGVDARWVTRALQLRYRRLLRDERTDLEEFRELFGSAGPHDYLEKIFQIPFWLRPMSEDASTRMLAGLIGPTLEDAAEADGLKRSVKRESGPAGTPPTSVDAQPHEGGVPGRAAADAGDAVRRRGAAEEARDADEETGAGAVPEIPLDLSPESVEVSISELEFMKTLAPLLGRSPRALKRFVNVYRLIKASLLPHQRQVFIPVDRRLGEYAAVLFLLAVDTGAPRAAVPLFRALRNPVAASGVDGPRTVKDLVEQIVSDEADWAQVCRWLDSSEGEGVRDADASLLARAARRVSRFSFHTGRLEGEPRRPAAPGPSSEPSPDPSPDPSPELVAQEPPAP